MTGEHNVKQRLADTPLIPREIALRVMNTKRYDEWRAQQEDIASAQCKPLPGAAFKAFTTGAIKAGGRYVSRVVPAHFAILQALDSPLIKMIENATNKKDKEIEFKPSQQWEVCYVFTEDAEKCYTLLENEGAKAVKSAAKREVGLKWEAAAVNLVLMAVLEQVKRHIQTTVKMVGEMEKEGDVTFFQEQPEKP